MEAKELAYSSLLGFGLNVSLQLYLRKLTMYCETGKRKKYHKLKVLLLLLLLYLLQYPSGHFLIIDLVARWSQHA